MMKTKLPLRKSHTYSFFWVPEDHRRLLRLRVSSWQLRSGSALLVILLVLGLFHAVGFWRYRTLYRGVRAEHQANVQSEQERSRTLEQLAALESVVESAEDYANNLATLVGTERPQLRKGIGSLSRSERSSAEGLTWELLSRKVEGLQGKTKSLDLRIRELTQIQENKLIFKASTPSIWPVKGWVTSEFGYRRSPFTSGHDFHGGIDIASQWGTAVNAPGAGVVAFAGYKGELGRAVIIDHGYGIRSFYGHASALHVREGDIVTRGTTIARVGNSGHSTGPHLHYEIHVDGIPIDPMKYILQ